MRRNNMLLIYLTNKKDKLNKIRKYLLSRKKERKINKVGKKDRQGLALRKGRKTGGRKCYLMMFLKSFG